MRLNELVNALADRVAPELVSIDDILTTAYQTRLIAWNAMLAAAQVDQSGQGLHDAATDIARMAEMVSAHADTLDDGLTECLACLDEFQTLFEADTGDAEPLSDRVAALNANLQRVGERLAAAIQSLPNSMNRDVSDVSIDRIQLECLLRQALVNARDRLRAAALALTAVDEALTTDGYVNLDEIDTDRLVSSVRHRLAVLSRDADLGAAIRRQDAG
ncbi:MAG: hypothetical protein AAF499_07865 [Pseudomonadota bacterium]